MDVERSLTVEPPVQAAVLDLAAVDAELTRIEHRREILPELHEVQRLQAQRTAEKDAVAKVEIVLEDLNRDIRKMETEVDGVRKREERDRGLMEAGGGSKQLSELQHEVGSLQRRRGVLEDDLLELMERQEAAVAEQSRADAKLAKTDAELAAAQERRRAALADLEAAAQHCEADRTRLAATLPPELLAGYDEQRRRHGVGAAALQGNRCGACRIELDRGELSRIAHAPANALVTCPECGAMLVRGARSPQ